MTEPAGVILGTLITEKAERLKAGQNKYSFRVHVGANKIEIRKAVERLFKIHVIDVRVMNFMGKKRRMGIFAGRKSNWKKAVVTVKQGETIEALER